MLSSPPYTTAFDGIAAYDGEGRFVLNAPRIRTIPLPLVENPLPTSADPEDAQSTAMLALSLVGEPVLVTAPTHSPLLFDVQLEHPSILHPVLAYRRFGRPRIHHILGNSPADATDLDTGFPLSHDVLREPVVSSLATTLHLLLYARCMGRHWISLRSSEPVTVGHVLQDLNSFLLDAVPGSAWKITQPCNTFLRVLQNFENRVTFELGCTLEEATSRGEPIRWIDTLEGCVSLLGLVEDSYVTNLALREGRCEPGDQVLVVLLSEDAAIRV